jgi:4-carboxymuconolactone decarboxylase
MNEISTRSRLAAPAEEALTDAQRAIVAAAIRSLGGVYGPRIPLLHSQDVAVAWSQMGRALKTSALEPALRELTILVVGQYWKAEFEWHAHAPKAAAAGITEQQLDA